jgi:hypothetical protein
LPILLDSYELTPFLTPTAFPACNRSAAVGNEQGNYKENSENDNCLNAGQLGMKRDGLALAVTGKKEKPTDGFEPSTPGLQNQSCKNITDDKTKTCETAKEQLTPQLTPKSEKQARIDTQNLPADLAEIVKCWPRLSDAIRSAIVAIVRASNDRHRG